MVRRASGRTYPRHPVTSEHYIVTANHGHLRIFRFQQPTGHSPPAFEEVQSLDFPAGRQSYTDRDTDMAGRFQGSKQQGRGPGAPTARTGMSIDERLPMQREEERRQVTNVSETIDSFLQARPEATWDFAAGPEIHRSCSNGWPHRPAPVSAKR
ncbi:MAG: host attachment protein [Opitutus sp.]